MKDNLPRPASPLASSSSFVSTSETRGLAVVNRGLLLAHFVAGGHWAAFLICFLDLVLMKGHENVNKTLTRVLPVGLVVQQREKRLTREQELSSEK